MASSSCNRFPDLPAPLRLLSALRRVGAPLFPIGADAFASTLSQEGRVATVLVGDEGCERWRVPGSCTTAVRRESGIVTVLDAPSGKNLVLLEPSSGRELSREVCEFSMDAVAEGGNAFVGTNVQRVRPRVVELACVSLEPGAGIRWRIRSEEGDGAGVYSFDVRVAEGRVVAGRECGVDVLDLQTGEPVWERRTDSPGRHRWNPLATKNKIVLDTRLGTEVVEATTGRLCWRTNLVRFRCVGDGRLTVLGLDDRFLEFDLDTGAVLHEIRLRDRARRRGVPLAEFTGMMAVSQTHLYVGDTSGRVWAFSRTSDDLWVDAPSATRAGSGSTVLAAADGALYVASGRWSAERDPYLLFYGLA